MYVDGSPSRLKRGYFFASLHKSPVNIQLAYGNFMMKQFHLLLMMFSCASLRHGNCMMIPLGIKQSTMTDDGMT